MTPLWFDVVIALALDHLLGEPRRIPHPVVAIGQLAQRLERPLRKRFDDTTAGVFAVAAVVGASVGSVTLIVWLAALVHPLIGDLASILLIYLALAMRSLREHADAVHVPLVVGDLEAARARVKMLVGRDCDSLGETEVVRATVESVAENTVDGVTAPMIFALLGGAPGVFFYKAVNTLDSTFGYKDERYLNFGWAAARLDDLVNFLPARITAVLVPFSAVILGLDGRQAWVVFRRDRHRHPSPNGGQIEAAMAGALKIRLGGQNSYFGQISTRPYMGDDKQALRAEHIVLIIKLMTMTSLMVLVVGVLIHWAISALW